MRLKNILLSLSIIICTSQICNARELNFIYDSIDLSKIIELRNTTFSKQKELIEEEQERLQFITEPRERFESCYRIFDLSRSFRFDIADKYSAESLQIATKIGDPNLICRARACRISVLTSGGLFTEAAKIIDNTNLRGVSNAIKREFYYNAIRYYSDVINYTEDEQYCQRYREDLLRYTKALIALTADADYYDTYARAYNASMQRDYDEMIKRLGWLYHESGLTLSEHHASIITYLLGNVYFAIGDENRGFEYMACSMLHDTNAAARENRSIKRMAQHLFERGEMDLADELINIALEDAQFYNARHRNLEINSLLPIINERKLEIIEHQQLLLYILIALISIVGAAAIIFSIIARKTALEVKLSRAIVQRQLNEISSANQKLEEANSIKEYYIIESLRKKNESLKQIETILKKIDVKVKNKLFDDLQYIYKDFNIKQERNAFYTDFDRAFLKLFPNFIDEFNKLFAPEDMINLSDASELPTEVRIFALMRLGVCNNEQISQFFDISINTIYTYKTKVKNRTIVDKESFESRILEIALHPTKSEK